MAEAPLPLALRQKDRPLLEAAVARCRDVLDRPVPIADVIRLGLRLAVAVSENELREAGEDV